MKIFSIATSLIAALAVLGACGKAPTAKEQQQGQVTLPDYPGGASGGFALTDDQGFSNFEGNLILWNESVTPPLIQAVSEGSINGRLTKASALRFILDEYLPSQAAVDDAKRDLDAVNARIAKAESRGFATPEMKAQTKPVAEQWFDGRLTELADAGAISDADRTHATTMFGAYCESKLWELATSQLAHETFDERPTPNQMCEPYFAARGYFADEALCGDAASGRNYFDCLWREGVLKSALMVPELATKACPGTDVHPNRLAAIQAWVANGLLKAILNDRSQFESTTYADKMMSYILAANENISSTGLPAKAEYADLKRCRSAFRRDFSFAVDRWDAAPPYSLRDIAEAELLDVAATTYKLLPSSGDAEADKRNYQKLANYVKLFGKRNQVVTTEPAASYSDYMFNQKSNGTTLELNGLKNECDIVGKAGSSKCSNVADPAFSKFAELKRQIVPAADFAAQARLTKAVAAAEENAKQSKLAKDAKLKAINGMTAVGATSVNAPGATVFFNGFSVKLVRSIEEGQGLTVIFRMNESQRGFVGCIAMTEGGSCSVQASLLKNATPLDVSYDGARGKLTIRALLTEPEAHGFGLPARENESDLRQSFNDIGIAPLAGRVLEVEMYANRLSDVLDFFTGDAKVFDGDIEMFTGSVSGDNFSDAQARIDGRSATFTGM